MEFFSSRPFFHGVFTMSFSLDFLEEAFAPITKTNQVEHSFLLTGIPIVVKNLSSEEETELNKISATMLSDSEGENKTENLAEFLLEIRTTTLAYAIVEVNGNSFREIKTFDTGQKTDSGKSIVISKVEALKKYLKKNWSQKLIQDCYEEFEKFKNVLEGSTDEIETEVSDLDLEIQKLKESLEALEKKKSEQLEAIKDQTLPEQLKTERKPFIPTEAEPPQENKQFEPLLEEHASVFGGSRNLEQEVQREQDLLLQKRATPLPSKEDLKSSFQEAELLEKKINGKDVYRLTPQEIPKREETQQAPVFANPDPRQDSRNPRFVPARKG